MKPVLRVENCGIHFGGLKALSDFSFTLQERELMAIIGPNGAGKTTFFNLLTGVYEPTEGSLLFYCGQEMRLNGLKPHQVSHAGIARTFQNIRLFGELTVEENVLMAFHRHLKTSLLSSVLKTRKYLSELQQKKEQARELLCVFGLESYQSRQAKNLSYGDQRRLEIVRALATEPRLLLLDEPAAGMNPTEKNHLMDLIRQIHQCYPLSIILIEHDMNVVMSLCPRILVLDYGELIAEGSPKEIQKNPKVIEAYLGTVDIPAQEGISS